MIIPNGNISVKIKVGGGIDEHGDPIDPSSSWSEPIPCRYRLNTSNYKAISDGNAYKDVTYEILIDEQPFSHEQIKLESGFGHILGEFSIRGIELEDTVGVIKMYV